jgi:hypothetical protein
MKIQVYDEQSFKKMHLSVFRKTNMIENLINEYSEDEALLKEFQVKKEQIMDERERLRAACDPVLSVLDRDDVKEVFH